MRPIVLERSKLLGFRICDDSGSKPIGSKIGEKAGVKRSPVRISSKLGKVGFKRT